MDFCIITAAASGIRLRLARVDFEEGHQLLLADRDPAIERIAADLGAGSVVADLSTREGVDTLCNGLDVSPDILMVNSGRSLGHAFTEQPEEEILDVMETNVTGTTMRHDGSCPGWSRPDRERF